MDKIEKLLSAIIQETDHVANIDGRDMALYYTRDPNIEIMFAKDAETGRELTLDEQEQAKREIESAESDLYPVSDFVDNGYERIVIISRPIGWSGNGNHVYEIERKEQYNEQEDECYWERING